MEDKLTVIKDGFIAVLKNKIVALGSGADIKNYQAEQTIDAGNSIVTVSYTHLTLPTKRIV